MKIGVALGGGGAKGLAHILILEVLDELGLRPHVIAGTSSGAIVGGLYASGLSAQEIKAGILRPNKKEQSFFAEMSAIPEALRMVNFVDFNFMGGKGGFVKGDSFTEFYQDLLPVRQFSALKIPLKVVATDFWQRKPVILEEGEIAQAVKASMAIPVIFAPVVINDQVLVDGGCVNPVPYDLIQAECDFTIAVDVLGIRKPSDDRFPGITDGIFNTYQIMSHNIVLSKLAYQRPDIYLEPEIEGIRMFEFYRANEIFKQAYPVKEAFKKTLASAIETSDKRAS